jgi:hypothetical protein
MLLLCLIGTLEVSFLERWTRNLPSTYACFYRIIARYWHWKAWLIWALLYVTLSVPCSLLTLQFMLFLRVAWTGLMEPVPIVFFSANTLPDIWLLHALSIFLLSIFYFRLLSHWVTRQHRYLFEQVENRVAFNVNSCLSPFFRQHTAIPMKKYGSTVPLMTFARLSLPYPKAFLHLLVYHLPADDALLLPTACEALDALRARAHPGSSYSHMVVCIGTPPIRIHALKAFFLASEYQVFLPADASFCVCHWTAPTRDLTVLSLSHVHDERALTPYYTLLPLHFSFTVCSESSDSDLDEPAIPSVLPHIKPKSLLYRMARWCRSRLLPRPRAYRTFHDYVQHIPLQDVL